MLSYWVIHNSSHRRVLTQLDGTASILRQNILVQYSLIIGTALILCFDIDLIWPSLRIAIIILPR